MRSKVTVVLLFLNVVVFAYIYYFMVVKDPGTLEARRRVLPPQIASLESFARKDRTGETVKLEKRRNTNTWWLTTPFEWPANPNAVTRIHNELQFLEHETSFTVDELTQGGQSLADYGLDNPAMVIDLVAAETAYQLRIGDDTKTGNRLYLHVPQTGRIHVVSRSLAESVGLPLAALRNESVFTVPVFEVGSLNIQIGANLKVRLRRDQAARWGFETPILARANKAAVETTINGLSSLTAKSFPDRPEAERTGLDSPALRVTFEGNARRETLLIGQVAPDGSRYARFEDKPVVFTTDVPKKLFDDLTASQEALRDPHVLDFDRATVTSIALAAPGQPEVTLQRLETAPVSGATAPAPAGPQWQLVTRSEASAPVTVTADPDVVKDLLDRLERLSVVKFLTDAPSTADLENYGFNRPEREVRLGLTTGGGLSGTEPSTAVLQIGVSPDRPGVAFARLTNPPFVYEILPDILDTAPARPLHYRQRLLRRLPEGAQLTAATLVDLAGGDPIFALQLKEGEKDWDRFLATINPEPVRKALRAVVDELGTLRAARFTAESFSADQAATPEGNRPWRYRLDYTIAFPGAPEATASLFLTERLGGSTLLAGTADFGGVTFAVTQPLLDALHALTYAPRHDPGPAAPPAETK